MQRRNQELWQRDLNPDASEIPGAVQFATLPEATRAEVVEAALRLTCDQAFEAGMDSDDRAKLIRVAKSEGISESDAINSTRRLFQSRAHGFYAACLEEARKLAPSHTDFDALGFLRAYEKFRRTSAAPAFIRGKIGDDDARVMALLAAQGQALLYTLVTGIAVPGDLVPTHLDHLTAPSDVFLSYSHEDGIKAGLANTTLRLFGFDTWMDRSLESAKRFDAQINTKIRAARAIVVLWSRASIASRWVQAEAMIGFERENLVPLLLEPCDIPVPLNLIQAFDFRTWDGDENHPTWNAVRQQLENYVPPDQSS